VRRDSDKGSGRGRDRDWERDDDSDRESDRDRESEVEKTARMIRYGMTGSFWFIVILLVVVVGAPLLLCGACFFGGVFSSLSASVRPKPAAPAEQFYTLPATVTWMNQDGRQIGLQHNGIQGRFGPGNNTFPVPRGTPWPDVKLGQKVVCVLRLENGQFSVTEVRPSR
jgi:hypothetical protein